MKKNILIEIKLTHECNLSCEYCYNNSKPHKLNRADITKFFKWIKNDGLLIADYRICFVWHGGEPLLLGCDFFEELVGMQKKYLKGVDYYNGLQTNGTLVDHKIAKFLKDNNFKISVSLDGNFHSNMKRVYKGTKSPAYFEIAGAVEILKASGNSIGIGSVVHSGNIDRVVENYQYFKNLKINYDIIPDFKINNLSFNNKFANKIDELFYLWISDQNPLRISFFMGLIKTVATGKSSSCVFDKRCLSGKKHFVIDTDLHIYPCSLFLKNKHFCLGKIGDVAPSSICHTDEAKNNQKFAAALQESCRGCEIEQLCNGGCIYVRSRNTSYYCEAWKRLFKRAKEVEINWNKNST